MNWKHISNPDKIGLQVHEAADAMGFNYSCLENPALRSCTRDNEFVSGQNQVYGCPAAAKRTTVDVEDLGRCFEDLNSVNYHTKIFGKNSVALNEGKGARNVYRGILFPRVKNFNRNIRSYEKRAADHMRDKNNLQDRNISFGKNILNDNIVPSVRREITPSERTWVNMKKAFIEDYKDHVITQIDPIIENHPITASDTDEFFLSSDLTNMAIPMCSQSGYSLPSTKWPLENQGEFYCRSYNNNGDVNDNDNDNDDDQSLIYNNEQTHLYQQSQFCSDISWINLSHEEHLQQEKPHSNISPMVEKKNDYQSHNQNHYERQYFMNQFHNHEQNKEKIHTTIHSNLFTNSNFCSEDQWLRCHATSQCPTLQEQNYNFNSNSNYNQINAIPCMDQSSKLLFYYGQDIGYLTPAEYLSYEEDSLSNEKRKEKSRDAARSRRSRETNIFTELAHVLPVPIDQAAHLDKASVMRLAIAYLKVRTVIDAIPEPLAKAEPSQEMDGMFLKALDGFMLVLSSDGDMVYLSENVSEYLGVSQMDMMGQNVYDYSHPCDHDELRECLSMKPSAFNDEKQICNLFLRLKCTLTSKGRKVNLKSASYKVIHCTGHMIVTPRDLSTPLTENEDNDDNSDGNEDLENNEKIEKGTGGCLIVVGCPVPHPSNIEAPLGRYTFLSKHSLNMKFTYADEKLAEYLGWDNNEMVGQSVFEFHHALDNLVLDKSFKSLFSKGQCETPAYRFLGKKGGYVWVVTQATLIHCTKQHKPLSVVCVNYILSGIECENEVYSARQLEARSVDASASSLSLENNNSSAIAKALAPVSLIATVSILDKDKNEEGLNSSVDIDNGGQLLIGKNIQSTSVPVNVDVNVDVDAVVKIPIQERQRPLSVTASIFRSQEKPQREAFAARKILDPQKEVFKKPSTVPSSTTDKIFAQKNHIHCNSKKENIPVLLRNDNTTSTSSTPSSSSSQSHSDFIFQGKPVKYFSSEIHRSRPQVVTRSLFAPAPQLQDQPNRSPPQTTTASIFAPRTKDMNKGFLTFSEDQPGLTMLKDEPEDLTHLAPTPGDVCVPLEDTPFLSEMLDDFLLTNDNYCPLLSPGLPNDLRATELGDSLKDSDLDESLRSSELGESLADSDPFIYRDTPSSCSQSPNLLSPALSKSPGSIDSLCSPSGSGGGLSEDEMLMLSIGDVLADEELALRAPYIPMSDQDETLQLFISNDMVMWPQPPDKKPKWSNINENNNSESDNVTSSSLEQLLRNNNCSNIKKCNDHGGGLVVDPKETLENIYKKNVKEETKKNWNTKLFTPQKRLHCTISNFENIDNNNHHNHHNKRVKCNNDEKIELELELELELDSDIVMGNLNIDNSKGGGGGEGGGGIGSTRGGINNLNHHNNNINNFNLSSSSSSSSSSTLLSSQSGNSNGSSQLLQQLMSQQSPNKNRSDHSNGGTDDGGEGGRGVGSGGRKGNGSCGSEDSTSNSNSDTNINTNAQQQQQQQQSNSVLMNLLVSGCDEVIDPRNVPPLLQRKISPLTVNLDNQSVLQMPANIALDHLSPDTRNELVNSLPKVTNKLNTPQELEPMDFENFCFDVSPLSFDLLQATDLLKMPANNLV